MSVQSISAYMLYASTTTEDYEVSIVNINVLLAMQHGVSTLIPWQERETVFTHEQLIFFAAKRSELQLVSQRLNFNL